jgi:hypothetical protein
VAPLGAPLLAFRSLKKGAAEATISKEESPTQIALDYDCPTCYFNIGRQLTTTIDYPAAKS